MLTCLVDTTTQATSEQEAQERLMVVNSIEDIPVSYIERLRDGANRSQVFAGSQKLSKSLNKVLAKWNLPELSFAEQAEGRDDEAPF